MTHGCHSGTVGVYILPSLYQVQWLLKIAGAACTAPISESYSGPEQGNGVKEVAEEITHWPGH